MCNGLLMKTLSDWDKEWLSLDRVDHSENYINEMAISFLSQQAKTAVADDLSKAKNGDWQTCY